METPVRCSACPFDTECRFNRYCAEIKHRLIDAGLTPGEAAGLAQNDGGVL